MSKKLEKAEAKALARAQKRIAHERKQSKKKTKDKHDDIMKNMIRLAKKYYNTDNLNTLTPEQLDRLTTWNLGHSVNRGKIQRGRGYSGKANKHLKIKANLG